jgi:hypothetical protein
VTTTTLTGIGAAFAEAAGVAAHEGADAKTAMTPKAILNAIAQLRNAPDLGFNGIPSAIRNASLSLSRTACAL